MVGALAEHDHELGALAAIAVVLTGHLDGRLHGLAAALGEEDMVEVAGHVLGHLGGQLDGRLVGDLKDVVDRQLLGLFGDGVEDLLPAVPHVDRPEAGKGVDVGLAVDVPYDGAFGVVHDDGLDALHLGEGRPEMLVHLLFEQLYIRFGVRRCHRSSSRCGWQPPPSGRTRKNVLTIHLGG